MTDWDFTWEGDSTESDVILLSPQTNPSSRNYLSKLLKMPWRCWKPRAPHAVFCPTYSHLVLCYPGNTCNATPFFFFLCCCLHVASLSGSDISRGCPETSPVSSLISLCSLVASCCAVASPRVPNMPTINKSDWLDCKGTANATRLSVCLL